MYVCIYVSMYLCTYVCMCVYVCVYVGTHVSMYVPMYISMYVYGSVVRSCFLLFDIYVFRSFLLFLYFKLTLSFRCVDLLSF